MWSNTTSGETSGWKLGESDYINIYNKGGCSKLIVSGSAGRTTGGDIFELHAIGPSAWAYAEQYWRNLKHIHTVFYIGAPDNCFDGDANTFCVEWGIDYFFDPSTEPWMHGWKFRLNVTDGQVEDNDIGTDGSAQC